MQAGWGPEAEWNQGGAPKGRSVWACFVRATLLLDPHHSTAAIGSLYNCTPCTALSLWNELYTGVSVDGS